MNQGFESAHKLQQLLWSLCTAHDGGKGEGKGKGIKQMMVHFYATFILNLW